MKKGLLLITAFFAMIFANAQTTVFINEIHYDDFGGDTLEGVEIAGPAGTDLTNYELIAYNGNNQSVYNTVSLSGTISDMECGMGSIWFPIAGLQNGAPDGIALVTTGGAVIQFLSYEGSFTAADGPAVGVTSTDIGVSEPTQEMYSLQLMGTGTTYEDFSWATDTTSTYDAVNLQQSFCAGPVIPSVSFASSTRSRDEDNTINDTITVSLSSAALRTDTIYLSVGGGSATYTSDYTTTPDLSAGGMVEVLAGATSFEVIVSMQDDLVYEGNETFEISIDSVSDSLSIGATSLMTYTIVENDPSPFAVVDWASTTDNVTEGDAPFALDMNFNMPASSTDTIWVEVVNGAGVVYGAVNDYTIDSMIVNDTVMIFVNIADNGAEMNFTVNDDMDVESSENVTFNIVAVSSGLILGSDLTRTVTIADNDVPAVIYTSIVDIQTPGAGSDSSLYKGDDVIITGIVTAVRNGSGYWVQEGNGGPFSGIYVFDNTNTPSRGDSIIVEGTVDEYFNATQIENVVAYTNVSPNNPYVITDLAPMAVADEQYEGVMVRVAPNEVKNTSLGFGEYSLGSGNDTIRIDDFIYSYILPAEGDSVGITGVAGFSFDNWKIFPRDSADILEISVTPPAVLSISDIQTPFNAAGDSPYDGMTITTSGIVTAVKDSSSYWIQEGNGGPYSGVYVYDFNNYPQEGDSVIVTAAVDEYFGLTELTGVVAFQNVSAGNSYTITDITTDEMNNEKWEGVMVKLTEATCIGDTNQYGEWIVDDGSGAAVANDFLYLFDPTLNSVYNVTGVVDYNFSEYKINPRYEADVEEFTVSIEEGLVNITNVYPNPTSSRLNVELTSVNNALISVIDLSGKTINSIRTNSINNSISVEMLNSGVYFLEVRTAESVERVKFIKK